LNQATTLFDRLGGESAINLAVDVFYRKVLTDDRISHFFDSVDMERQHVKQKAFLTMAFGGPNQYTGQDMRRAHAHMKLTEEHFSAVMEHLAATLQELGANAEDIGGVASIALSVKEDVLNR
jgi:hemoglobin